MFGNGMYGGFEATVIFRDKVRDPERTTPRAMYAVVILLASLYSLTSWKFINSYGAEAIMAAVTADPTWAVTASIKTYIGEFGFDILPMLLLTSSFAAILASHNIAARYIFNLNADRVLDHALNRVHHHHMSPHSTSIAVTAASLAGLTIVVVARVDETTVYGRLAGPYTYML